MMRQLISVAIMVLSIVGLIHESTASAEEKDTEAVRAAAVGHEMSIESRRPPPVRLGRHPFENIG